VLPYAPLALYSAFLLLTTGSGIPPGPNGIYGLAEGFAIVNIFGVAIWSLFSWLSGTQSLPKGPLGIWDLTQKLCTICSAVFIGAAAINTYEPDNPFRGLSFSSPPTSWQAAAGKATTKVIKATEAPRSQIDGMLKEAGKNAVVAADKASKPVTEAADKAVKSVTDSASKAATTITSDLTRMYKEPKAKIVEAQVPKATVAEPQAPKAATTSKAATAETQIQAPAPAEPSAKVLDPAVISKETPASVA